MNPKIKQLLLIAAFLLSAVGIGVAIYFAFFRQVIAPPEVTPPPVTTGPGGVPTGLPAAGTGAPTPVTPGTGEVLRPADLVARGGATQVQDLTTVTASNITLSGGGQAVNFYSADDGKFYKVGADGTLLALSDKQFPAVSSVAWNKSGDKAVLEFPDGSNVVYDFVNQKQVTLPKHWEDFAFSPNADEIVAKNMAVDPDNRWLIVSNADGSNVKPVQALGLNANKVQVSWSPNDQVIAFSDTAPPLVGGADRKMVLPLGQAKENFKGLVIEGWDFRPNWSPDGRQLLYSATGTYSADKPLLWVVDATPATMGENRRSLGLNTWAEKCAFASATVAYCAVPRDLPDNAGLQPSLYASLPDDLYRVDLGTGKTSLAAVPAQDTTFGNMTVSADGSTLYFVNAASGRLETIKLK